MIDSYIILNRKTNFIIKVFIFNFFLILLFVIWSINTFSYQSFFHIHSQVLKINSFYYLEVLIPVKEVYQITKQNKIIINSKEYNYHIEKIDTNFITKNQENYNKIYLKVDNLEKEYLVNGYQIDIKILKETKKIIDYMKE